MFSDMSFMAVRFSDYLHADHDGHHLDGIGRARSVSMMCDVNRV